MEEYPPSVIRGGPRGDSVISGGSSKSPLGRLSWRYIKDVSLIRCASGDPLMLPLTSPVRIRVNHSVRSGGAVPWADY